MTIYLSEQEAQRAGLTKRTTRRKPARDARPDLPRAKDGEGDRIAQLMRIAAYGYSPRFDAGQGFCFWNFQTGQRTSVHQEYAVACAQAEQALKGVAG